MNYKKLIVSADNKLVLEDYNLNSNNSEILDLNKSLSDVVQNSEIELFIKENAIDPSKVYLICLKENFGSNEQRIENIPNVKKLYKQLKKQFKKYSNIFFFIYNTFSKNETSFNPELPVEYEPNEFADNNLNNSDIISPNENIGDGYENNIEESFEEYPSGYQDEQIIGDEYYPNESIEQIESIGQESINQEQNYDDVQQETTIVEENDVINTSAPPSISENLSEDNNQLDDLVVEVDPLNVDINNNEWEDLESSNSIVDNEQLLSNQIVSPYENEIKRFNDITLEKNKSIVNDDDIEIPETYYEEDNEDQLSYEDYQEFQNDYELNVHALKSIYDFVWRMLILNNYNLKLNDLLYLSVNNLDAFSIGQSDFVRQVANRSESLFDLILQLDIKLEFNNSLFYIYLAELFTIKANRIIVNENFLNTLSIWVNKSSKEKFISQVEQFINYSTIYNKKIIFSYFIELSNFIKGSIPTISSTLNLVDIHRLLVNQSNRIRRDNIFGFMIQKMNEVFKINAIGIESYIAETPENMFSSNKNSYLDNVELNWKSKLSLLYKKLLENIRNYVLLKGNNETEIFNLYVDIKDLKMYKGEQFTENPLSVSVVDAFNNNGNYLTIGDAFERTPSIVPSQNNYHQDYSRYSTPDEYRSVPMSTINNEYPPYQNPQIENRYVDSSLRQPNSPVVKFNIADLENSMSKRIEEYEKRIKENISRIENERKNLREKMEFLKKL